MCKFVYTVRKFGKWSESCQPDENFIHIHILRRALKKKLARTFAATFVNGVPGFEIHGA